MLPIIIDSIFGGEGFAESLELRVKSVDKVCPLRGHDFIQCPAGEVGG